MPQMWTILQHGGPNHLGSRVSGAYERVVEVLSVLGVWASSGAVRRSGQCCD